MDSNFVSLAYFSALHGMQGGVKINTYRDRYVGFILEKRVGIFVDGDFTSPLIYEFIGIDNKGGIILSVSGVSHRDDARIFLGKDIIVLRDDLPSPDKNFFHHADLLDFKVFNDNGVLIAKVIAAYDFGSGEVVEVEDINSGKKEMLTFDEYTFKNINFIERSMIIKNINIIDAF